MTCFNTHSHIEIRGNKFLSEIYQLDRDLRFMRRYQSYTTTKFIDAYASNWFVGIVPSHSQSVVIVSGSEEITVNPGSAVFLPEFSIVEWKILSKECEWYAYMGDFELPGDLKTKRFLFTPDGLDLPTKLRDFKLWLHNQSQKSRVLQDQKVSSAIALRFKNLIDRSFQDDILITQAAEELGVSRVVLTRAFTRAYGLSPVQYRNKLRVFEGLKLYMKFKRVSEICSASGFSHHGQYIKNFRSYLGVNPKTYFTNKLWSL